MAFSKLAPEDLPTRVREDELAFVSFAMAESDQGAIEIKLRRLVARSVGRQFLARSTNPANP